MYHFTTTNSTTEHIRSALNKAKNWVSIFCFAPKFMHNWVSIGPPLHPLQKPQNQSSNPTHLSHLFPMSPHPLLCFLLLPFLLPSAAQHDGFTFTGFSGAGNANSNSHIAPNGIAEVEPNGLLRLTNITSRLIGHAFYPTPIRLKDSNASSTAYSFSTSFVFAFIPEFATLGGHGLAFALTPSPLLPGALPSQYLGLLSAADNGNATNHILAVEFDTVQDFEFGDINDNHVGVNLNSMTSNASAAVSYIAINGTRTNLTMKTGALVQAWIDYDGVSNVLNVSIAPASAAYSKPKAPLLSYPVNIAPVLHDSMYVGFSASTGLLASSHYIFGWSFKVNAAAPPLDLSALPSIPKPKKRNTTLVTVAASVAVAASISVIAAAAYLCYRIRNADIIEQWELDYGPHRFSYSELKRATKGFSQSELLGFGGFGKVYKGKLNGSDVAVKRVSHESRQGLREFVAEIASIGRLRHRNLVQLQGWCRRRGDLLLVYDYMPNGSLDKFLFDTGGAGAGAGAAAPPPLSWSQRFCVLRGVASALLYLHEEWEHVVIHRDVKASNVLLDGDLSGRLGDFGLAKLYEHGANPSTTRVVGTLGYLAPELTRSGRATTGSDVFAFGALALEVVCGRRPIEPKALPEELILVDWVWDRWGAERWPEVVDHRLCGDYDRFEAEVAIKVGLMCSHPAASARPSMREVVRYLDGSDAVVVPELKGPPLDYESMVRVGFEDFVHSYPSSSFEKVSFASLTGGRGGEESEPAGPRDGRPFAYSPLSLLSRVSV